MKKFLAGILVTLASLYGALYLYTGYVKAGVSCSLPFNLQNNTTADATQVMANYNALVTCLGNAAAAGSNSDITALLGLTTPLVYTAGGSSTYIGGTTTGTALVQVLANPTPNGFSLTAGKTVIFTPGFTNTATTAETTLNINSLGAINVHQQTPSGQTRLFGGELQANQLSAVTYDGTEYILTGNGGHQFGGYGALVNVASSGTTDLGLTTSHNLNITGAVTITSFASSASTTWPLYQLTFGSNPAPLLTYNATSLILPGAANIQASQNDTATAAYLGSGNWQILNYAKANGTAPVNPTPLAGFFGLTVHNNAGTPNTQIDLAYSSAVLINPTGNVPSYVTGGAFTINLTNGTVTSACNGMDGEARGTSAWVYIWTISDGTTPCALGSLSSSAPTLPTNYIYKAYSGAMRVDGSGNLLRSRQVGSKSQLQVVTGSNVPWLTPMASANVGVTWTAIAVGAFVPTTAAEITVIAGTNSGNALAVAPNSNYTTSQGSAGIPCLIESAANLNTVVECTFILESTNIYYQNSNTNNGIWMLGWKDVVNAN